MLHLIAVGSVAHRASGTRRGQAVGGRLSDYLSYLKWRSRKVDLPKFMES